MRTISQLFRWLLVLAALACPSSVRAATNYTWNNTATSGYWTNGLLWTNTASAYPGVLAGQTDSAYLTNQLGGTYTNILNVGLQATVGTLAISNQLGETWLILTNATADPSFPLTNTTLSLGSGGRLQLDNGGVLTNTTTFGWAGTNGVIYLNQGGQLLSKSVTWGGNAVTAVITSASAPGSGGVWNFGQSALNVGGASLTGVVLWVVGGVVTNTKDSGGSSGGFAVGNGAAAFGNALIVTNGGQVWDVQTTNNKKNGVGIGDGANSNSLTIVGGSGVVSLLYKGYPNTIGSGAATGNVATVDGAGDAGSAIWTNAVNNPLTVGGSGGFGNRLILTNGGWYKQSIVVIGSNANSNRIDVTGPAGSVLMGDGGNSYLSVGIGSGTGNVLYVSNGGSVSGYLKYGLTVGGLGSGAAGTNFGNAMIIASGGAVYAASHSSLIGYTTGLGSSATSNSVLVTGAGAYWSGGNQALTVGAENTGSTATGNWLQVDTGGLVTNVTTLTVGQMADATAGGASVGNYVILTNGGQLFATTVNAGTLNGSGGVSSNNSVQVLGGGVLDANTLVTSGPGAGNTISNIGGIFQFSTATALTITTNSGIGSIAITNGTISFRGITTGLNLTNNWKGSQLTNLAWSGNNTLRLNNSTAANTLTGGYTFDTDLGATNYSRLELINGTTRVSGNGVTIGQNGSMLVSNTAAAIDGVFTNSGSLSVVGANATFASLVYNSGTNTMRNSVGTFSSGVINMGRWLTDPTTNVYGGLGYTNMISGDISMSAGDVYVFTNTPGGATANFINVSTNNVANNLLPGKMLFSGGLGLTQNFTVAGHDLGPGQVTPLLSATNIAFTLRGAPIPGFTNNFALGTLEISNFSTVRVTDAFLGLAGLGTNDNLMAGLYLSNLIMGPNSFLIISTNVQVYFISSNNWGSANFLLESNPAYNNSLNGLHQLVVVPEPSVMLLWLCGLAALYYGRRKQ